MNWSKPGPLHPSPGERGGPGRAGGGGYFVGGLCGGGGSEVVYASRGFHGQIMVQVSLAIAMTRIVTTHCKWCTVSLVYGGGYGRRMEERGF